MPTVENNEKKETALEFTFEDPEMKGGLVFETQKSTVSSEAETPKAQEPVAEKTAEAPKKEEKKPEDAAVKSPADGEEFGVPDSFRVNEKYNTPIRDNERTRIYTTYVPRFTEVSETYRMKDDPRPRPKTAEPAVTRVEEKPKEKPQERVCARELVEEPVPPITPVPEIEDAVIVNVADPIPDTDSEDSINIFKFQGEEVVDFDRMNVEEENANRKALNELKARQAERRAREEAARLAEEEAEKEAREAARNVKLAPEDYEIPDPDRTGFVGKGAQYSAEADYDTPHGIPTDSEKAKKFKLSEYTSAGQRDSFKDRFLDSLVALRIRIAAVILVALIALFLENASFFGINIGGLLGVDYMPSAIALIDFQLVLGALLLTLPETLRAIKALMGKRVHAELSLPISFIALTAYTAVIASSKYYIGYPVFGFVFIVSALVVLISSYLRKLTEFESFKFISVKGEKRIIEHEETRKYPRTMLALDGAVDGYKSNTARTFRTTFVSSFFENSSKTAINSKNNLIMILSALGTALVTALVSFFLTKTNPLPVALASFTVILTFAISSVSLLSRSIAYYHAGREARTEGSTLIGECAYSDTASVDVIRFEDTEIFGEDDVNLKRFGFYGGEDTMNRSMRLICSLFASVGGPLHIIFSKTLEKRCTPATDPVIEEDGVRGNVDGKTVCAGTAEYMIRHGIKIPEDNERAYGGFGAESMKTMYGAESGVIFAKFYIRYSFSEEFTSLLPALREEHIVPLVYTSDPNISNELLRTLTVGGDCMRVMKRKTPSADSDKVYPRLNATAVTDGDKINAIKLVLTARKYKRFMEKCERAEIIAMASGTALAAVLSVIGLIGTVPTLALGALQLAAAFVLGFLSKRKFHKGNR